MKQGRIEEKLDIPIIPTHQQIPYGTSIILDHYKLIINKNKRTKQIIVEYVPLFSKKKGWTAVLPMALKMEAVHSASKGSVIDKEIIKQVIKVDIN